jgi:phosphatidylserine/phosphatidylglycerophosphate/cardiolipin synthase-like enzyme
MNIGDRYAGTKVGGNGYFRDTHCKVEGPAVQHLANAFLDSMNDIDAVSTKRERIEGGSEEVKKKIIVSMISNQDAEKHYSINTKWKRTNYSYKF